MAPTVVAADLGGTLLRAAVVEEGGSIVHRASVPTPVVETREGILERVCALLSDAVTGSGAAPQGTCIATAGLIDAAGGRVIAAPNIPGFRDLELAAPVSERLGLPTWIENDASAAALGEHRYGAGRGTRNLLHATLGTGIGGGIVIDGRLYRGARGLAGEIGHIIIDPGGPVCNCGSRGCLEAMVSGVAFAERARWLVATERAPILAVLVGERPATAADLYQAAVEGERVAEAEIRQGGHLLGLALGGLVNVLNPDAVTIGGGLLAMGDMLVEPLRQGMYSLAYGPAAGTLVRLSELGDDAGLLGAAAVAFERLESG